MALAALLHRTIPTWTVVVGATCLTSACTKVLVLRPTASRAEQWKLVVFAQEGRNRYRVRTAYTEPVRTTYIEPESGARFISFDVRLTNEASAARGFKYDRCDLDAGQERILPSIVVMENPGGMEAPEYELLAPGQEVTRRLVFAYPDGDAPTRLQCGALVIPLLLPIELS
jgi:hypothetical protein